MARTRPVTSGERIERELFVQPRFDKLRELQSANGFKSIPEACYTLWDEINEFDKKNGFVITHGGLRKIIGGEK